MRRYQKWWFAVARFDIVIETTEIRNVFVNKQPHYRFQPLLGIDSDAFNIRAESCRFDD